MDARPLVVGVDGSEPAMRAVDWAADEAALREAPLRVVHATAWERYEGAALARDLGGKPGEVRGRDIVEAAARRARARHPDLRVSAAVVPEEPEYALVHAGRNAAALVVGSRGRGGLAELLLGSVSLAVAAYADRPVFVLRGGADGRVASAVRHRVVVGVGEHPESSDTVRFAAEEARRRGAVLEAVRAWRCPAHEGVDHPLLAGEPERSHETRAAELLEQALNEVPADVKVHRRTVEGPARRVLLDASAGADLLVVGARRRADHVGLQLGRTAHAALHHSACPVAVVPGRS